MMPNHNQDDSTHAAKLAVELGVACLIVLGGDGTNRVVAKASREIPLLSIATGTNNVFSSMIEGTLAGIAAGVLARDELPLDGLTRTAPRLEIWRDNRLLDIALVDVVISNQGFIASRALWNIDHITEVFLTRAEPQNIGFSSLGGYLCHLTPDSGKGLHLRIGQGMTKIKAPIAPGLIKWVPIESYSTFESGHEIAIDRTSSVIALDGEREITMTRHDEVFIKLNRHGPRVVKLNETLQKASDTCLLNSND
jgi:predicted polyphosphate/ATP-dependent NAD kinase